MDELGKLKKENKQLRTLLKNAVELLNKYKDHLQQAGTPQTTPPKKKKRKSAAKAG